MGKIISILDKIKQKKGLKTDKALANLLKVKANTVSNWRKRGTLPYKSLITFCESEGIDIKDLLADEEKPPVSNAIPLRTIPVLGRVPAGFPDQIPAQEIIEYISCPDTQPGSYALIVKGDSMSPAIKAGDYVLFIPNGDINNGDVVVLNDEWGDAMIKRYREKDGNILLTSDNPEYPSYTPNENYRIIGKVVGAWRKIKV